MDFVSVIQPSYTFRPPPFYICFIYTPSILIPFKLPTENLTTNISTSHLGKKGWWRRCGIFVLFPCPHLFFLTFFFCCLAWRPPLCPMSKLYFLKYSTKSTLEHVWKMEKLRVFCIEKFIKKIWEWKFSSKNPKEKSFNWFKYYELYKIFDSLRFVGSFQPSAIVLHFISRLSSYI